MSKYRLYGTEHSYFTCKVAPYLKYKGIPHTFHAATLATYKRLIIPRTGVKFIPVLQTPEDEVWQDTTVIIDKLEARFPERAVYPNTPKQHLVALLFELYADEWFLLPAMHYRWSYLDHHEHYLMGEFGNIAGAWLPGPIKRAIGRKICAPFKSSLPALGITAKSAPAIEAWFLQFLADFEQHLQVHDYLLGSRPSLGDFALAGPMSAHIGRDPYSHAILQKHAPHTLQWIQRINADEQEEGAFLDNDEVPETLLPILQHMFAEQWPILRDTANALPGWLQAHPEKQRISRAIGGHEFKIGNVSEQRLMFPYAQWMMQRPLDYYAGLLAADQAAVDIFLVQCGGLEAMQTPVPQRLSREHNRIVLEADNAGVSA
ncbi:MAG: glutathione S-transferase family protein [Oceanococcus sp.]